jgi:hypothetical protein
MRKRLGPAGSKPMRPKCLPDFLVGMRTGNDWPISRSRNTAAASPAWSVRLFVRGGGIRGDATKLAPRTLSGRSFGGQQRRVMPHSGRCLTRA